MERFLDFLSKDLQAHPERLQAIDAAWVKRLQAIIKNTAIDLDAPLPNDGD
jgi:antitoxin PrlF